VGALRESPARRFGLRATARCISPRSAIARSLPSRFSLSRRRPRLVVVRRDGAPFTTPPVAWCRAPRCKNPMPSAASGPTQGQTYRHVMAEGDPRARPESSAISSPIIATWAARPDRARPVGLGLPIPATSSRMTISGLPEPPHYAAAWWANNWFSAPSRGCRWRSTSASEFRYAESPSQPPANLACFDFAIGENRRHTGLRCVHARRAKQQHLFVVNVATSTSRARQEATW